MQLADVNVLVYAHREDAPEHARYQQWLSEFTGGSEPFALSELVLSAFIRLITNGQIYRPPTPVGTAIGYCEQLRQHPSAMIVQPGPRHWEIFVGLLKRTGIQGPKISDVYLAALAIESDCEFITTDRDFARFPGLRWRHPLVPR